MDKQSNDKQSTCNQSSSFSSCGSNFSCSIQKLPQKDSSLIENIIAIMSGKGGVGKSSVTSLMAVNLARQGYKVGILDADITGPSIPKMFGLPPQPDMGNSIIFFHLKAKS